MHTHCQVATPAYREEWKVTMDQVARAFLLFSLFSDIRTSAYVNMRNLFPSPYNILAPYRPLPSSFSLFILPSSSSILISGWDPFVQVSGNRIPHRRMVQTHRHSDRPLSSILISLLPSHYVFVLFSPRP